MAEWEDIVKAAQSGPQPRPEAGPAEAGGVSLIDQYRKADEQGKQRIQGLIESGAGEVDLDQRLWARLKPVRLLSDDPERTLSEDPLKGAREYLESEFGQGNVEQIGSNNFAINDGGRLLVLENAGMGGGIGSALKELGKDALDILPEVAEGIISFFGASIGAATGATAGLPGGPAGVVGGALSGGAAGAGTGHVLRTAASNIVPGRSHAGEGAEYAGNVTREALGAAALDVAGGGAGELVRPVASAAKSAFTPQGRDVAKLRGMLGETSELGFGKQTAREVLEETKGEPLMSATQKAMTEGMVQAESIGRKRVPELYKRKDLARTFDVSNKIEAQANQISKAKTTTEEAFGRIALATAHDLDAAEKGLEKVAKEMYGEFEDIAGREARAKTSNVWGTLEDLKTRYSPKGKGNYGEGFAAVSDMLKNSESINIKDFQKARTYIGQLSAGKLGVFPSRAKEKEFGAELYAAISQDLQETALSYNQGRSGAAAKKLIEASNYYRQGMELVDAKRKAGLAVIIDNAAKKTDKDSGIEMLYDDATSGLFDSGHAVKQILAPSKTKTQVRDIMKAAKALDPAAARDFQRAAMMEAFGRVNLSEGSVAARVGARGGVEEGTGVVNLGKLADLFSQDPAKITKLEKISAIVDDPVRMKNLANIAKRAQNITAAMGAVGESVNPDSIWFKMASSLPGAGTAASAGAELMGRLKYSKQLLAALENPETNALMAMALNPKRPPRPAHFEQLANRIISKLPPLTADMDDAAAAAQAVGSAANPLAGVAASSADVYRQLQEERSQ